MLTKSIVNTMNTFWKDRLIFHYQYTKQVLHLTGSKALWNICHGQTDRAPMRNIVAFPNLIRIFLAAQSDNDIQSTILPKTEYNISENLWSLGSLVLNCPSPVKQDRTSAERWMWRPLAHWHSRAQLYTGRERHSIMFSIFEESTPWTISITVPTNWSISQAEKQTWSLESYRSSSFLQYFWRFCSPLSIKFHTSTV